MNTRRIQQIGGSSFNITLPKKWIKKNSLKNKDLLDVHELHNGSLLVKPKQQFKRKRVFINADQIEIHTLSRDILALYTTGVDEIEIQSEKITSVHKKTVVETLNLLRGFSIIEESSSRILIRNLLDNEKLSVDEGIERMFEMVIGMFDDTFAVLKSNDIVLAEGVITRDDEVDKFHLSMIREFNLSLAGSFESLENINPQEFYCLVIISKQLERIADHGTKIARLVVNEQTNNYSELLKNLEVSINSLRINLEKTLRLIKSFDYRSAHLLIDLCLMLDHELDTVPTKKYHEAIIRDSLDRMVSYVVNIIESLIDVHFLKQK